jgi:hypothetical protein
MTETVDVVKLKKIIALINNTIVEKTRLMHTLEVMNTEPSKITAQFVQVDIEELTRIRDDLMSTIKSE